MRTNKHEFDREDEQLAASARKLKDVGGRRGAGQSDFLGSGLERNRRSDQATLVDGVPMVAPCDLNGSTQADAKLKSALAELIGELGELVAAATAKLSGTGSDASTTPGTSGPSSSASCASSSEAPPSKGPATASENEIQIRYALMAAWAQVQGLDGQHQEYFTRLGALIKQLPYAEGSNLHDRVCSLAMNVTRWRTELPGLVQDVAKASRHDPKIVAEASAVLLWAEKVQ